jgi:hypothetical protein
MMPTKAAEARRRPEIGVECKGGVLGSRRSDDAEEEAYDEAKERPASPSVKDFVWVIAAIGSARGSVVIAWETTQQTPYGAHRTEEP